MLLEIAIVLALILLNGLLAMSELAIVSARPARLKLRIDRGDRGAAVAADLAAEPGRFLSTVQIGITLVGVLSGAFSGATLGLRVGAMLKEAGVSVALAEPLGVALVVVVITYLSLIVGELVPKQIALADPEAVAARMAPAMRLLSKIAMPLVWLLDRSGRLVLALIGQSGKTGSAVSDEEIRMIIAEAEGAGVIDKAENEMIQGVMRIADRNARGLMTGTHELEIAEAGDSRAQILKRFRESGHSRLPLRDGKPDEIIGVLHSRDVLNLPAGAGFDARALARPAPVIPEALPAMAVIERLKAAPGHLLLVYDEYGQFEGIITAMDILGAIAGGFDEDEGGEPRMVQREDGSYLVAGWMPVDEFAARLGLSLERSGDFDTLAGLVLDRAGVLPPVGRHVTVDGWRIEVVDLDGRRIDKLLVRREA
ncbi:MAG: hemolysin family protein [Paracoccus sp. (in: a-proteobacteria)]